MAGYKWEANSKEHPHEYHMWNNMHSRCYNTSREDYRHYGGKGITVCERWHDFDNFYADVGDVPPGMTLGRRDHNKGYAPDNWHWQTRAEQARDRDYCCYIEWDGREQTAICWARELGMGYRTILGRFAKGYPPEIILYQGNLLTREGDALLSKYDYAPLRGPRHG
jgi:hypothetical protein